jgi:RHS repeat-associated protein
LQRNAAASSTERTFAEHPFEEPAGLYYMKARWYDPASGRFLSADPVVRSLADPQAFNGYSYVENNPVNRVDPSGLFFLPIGFEGLFGIGGLGSTLNGLAGGIGAFNNAFASTQRGLGDLFFPLDQRGRDRCVERGECSGGLLGAILNGVILGQLIRNIFESPRTARSPADSNQKVSRERNLGVLTPESAPRQFELGENIRLEATFEVEAGQEVEISGEIVAPEQPTEGVGGSLRGGVDGEVKVDGELRAIFKTEVGINEQTPVLKTRIPGVGRRTVTVSIAENSPQLLPIRSRVTIKVNR